MDIAFLEGQAHSDALKSACVSMHRASLNEQDTFLYEAAEKRQLDWASSIYAAEQESRKEGEQIGLEKGKKEGEQIGLQKGKEEGRKEGEQIGLEKGRQEGEQFGLEKAQVKIATQMILAHLPSEQVSALTGLNAARVAQLIKQLGQ